jgi:inhibitor of cysteine peptidase
MDPARKALLVSLIIVGIIVPLSTIPAFLPTASGYRMTRFGSSAELISFLQTSPVICGSSITPGALYPGSPRTLSSVNSGSTTSLAVSPSYSTTNVQVQGVDELDTVKTDGQYIYTISNNTLFIVKAYPTTEAGIVSKITPNGTMTGVFVYEHSLVLIGGGTGPVPLMGGIATPVGASYPYWYSPNTKLWVYDISNIASPSLTFSLQENGTYVGSRLIGNLVYLITTQYAVARNDSVTLPSRFVNGQVQTTPATQIYHSDIQDYSYSFTTVSSVSLSSSPSLESQSFLISSSGTLYVSTGNIYLTSTIWSCQEETVIHRVNISDGGISYEATGIVPGRVMNQFSMDEYQGILRVATSSWAFVVRPLMTMSSTGISALSPTPVVGVAQLNGLTTNVYTLDMNLRVMGALEGLAPGEQFHSARFLGDRGYLVTFKKTDPLFIIDLRDPASLRILGELYANGYSDYLQPYDETHLIGIGKNATDASTGTFAWYQGVKVSLFDVTDPSNPREVSRYVIGDRGTTTPALTDSHAVLFNHDQNLLVIPVEVAQLPANNTSTWTWGTYVWQGAYVFNISPGGGIVFRGGITHLQSGETPSWTNSDHFVTRALYIGDVFYTISPAMVRMNSLADLSDLGSVNL